MSKGRKPTIIDKNDLQSTIDKIESENTYPNLSALWKAVEETDWAKGCHPRPLKAASIYQKVKELGITYKTKAGARGVQPGENRFAGKVGKRSSKVFNNTIYTSLKALVPAKMQQSLEKTLRKAATGNMKSAIRLKCMDCSGWNREEVRECLVTDCSLHSIRPFKNGSISLL